jgi:hypothetical protein
LCRLRSRTGRDQADLSCALTEGGGRQGLINTLKARCLGEPEQFHLSLMLELETTHPEYSATRRPPLRNSSMPNTRSVVGTPVQHLIKLTAHLADRMSPMIHKAATRAVHGRAHSAALIVFHNDA